ncbi:MAG: YqjF family protein [Verrucomicrobiaceae bacterium]
MQDPLLIPSIDQRLATRERPAGSPVMYQTWADLLFLHWEINPQIIREHLPKGLHVDLFNGKAYLGIVPFFMKNVRPKGLPALPWLSHFLELNVRTYVHDDQGRPGVWFFSLDCDQPIAVQTARTLFHLPYQHAKMSAEKDAGGYTNYRCRRKSEPNEAHYRYKSQEKPTIAQPGTLEFFLLERYLLFSEKRNGSLFCGQVHHPPYAFSNADIPEKNGAPLLWEGFSLTEKPISALVSPGVDVDIFPLKRLNL